MPPPFNRAKILSLIVLSGFVVQISFAQSPTTSSGKHKSTYSTAAPRDSHGKIKRSSSARKEFMKQTGYPKGRPGYVIDHVVPLSEGGKDDPSNMQWQTVADAKAKDKWERGQPAQKSKSSSSVKGSGRLKSSSSHSSKDKSKKPVHVSEYKTKRGTTVHSYHRASPGTGTHRSSSSHRSSSRRR